MAEEQGLTLVPAKNNFLTGPLHVLAVALAMQDGPCSSLLSQLLKFVPDKDSAPDPRTPLTDLMEADPGTLNAALAAPSSSVTVSTTSGVSPTDTAAAASPTALGPTLSSPATLHLVSRSKDPRRGEDGVQAGGGHHANGEEKLAAQWIFDRGAWDMTKVNKAFAYVFNTPQGDRKVARVLSSTQEQVARLQELLYRSCSGLKERRLNVSRKVLAVLTAYLIKYFPELKVLSPSDPIMMPVEECLEDAGIARADLSGLQP
ncbi:hypothetical protein PC121_g11535 [Phytophthora cactorum]|nr:hypothetical protein PC120_g25705 [Phytophthora cactorum]KAG3064869.1 hypothetical protein PC121_g11535 [Phytophthora cactorum]KAG4044297.1 hypothetical protein PC123_g20252 [Phytophthora cactorum]